MHILLVDDEPAIVELLASICVQDGHSVRSCTSSIEAVSLIGAEEFDLLVTDLNIPQLDGLALVRRAHGMRPDMQSMVITGHCGQYSLEEVLAAGVSDILLKPLRIPEFRARLKMADEQRQTRQRWKCARRELQEASAAMIQDLQRKLAEAQRQQARRLVPDAGAALPSSAPRGVAAAAAPAVKPAE